MKLTTILAWGFLLLFLGACSFSSDPQQTASGEGREIKPILLDPNLDDDGDMILNGEELKRGRNPLVAELPELKIRFLQNFKVLTADDQVLIDTQVGRDAPDFKYRVGELFLRSHAYKTAAMSGRFSTHSYGDIIERDISWINYPELDPRFFAQASLSDRKLLDANESFKISLENTVKLSEVGQFKSIKNRKSSTSPAFSI
jgi:hypothetical protein